MSENNMRPEEEEEALSDLIASAIKNKRTPAPEEQQRPPSGETADEELSLSDSIARAKYNKENGIRPQTGDKAQSEPDGEASIEDMVRNAMNMKAKGCPAVSQEHFVTRDDIMPRRPERQMAEQDDHFDDDIDEEEEKTGFFQKVKNFFIKHKLELMIAALVLVSLAIILIIAFIMIFNHYYNRIERGDNSIILDSINDIGDSDTVSDVQDYEDYLKDQLKDYADIMGSEDVYNLLLVGEDLRDTAGVSRGNTDVMLMVSINRSTKQITLTSFMRDIYLYIPGYYSNRLNSAYATGGTELLKDTIEQNFGVKIDNYVIVNFYTFIDIIDTIGGIDAEITDKMVTALRDPMREQNKYLGNPRDQDIITEPGFYHLNGNQALGYARIRHGVGDDYGRTARQREVITKMIEKARGLSLLELKELLDKITEGDNLRWDLEKEEVLSLLYNAFDYYKNYDIQELQIPASGTFSDQTIRNMQVLCPDFAKNTEILQMTIYGKTFVDPAVTSTYYLPPSPQTTTKRTYSTTTRPPHTDPVVTDPPEPTTTEEPYVPDTTTTPATEEPTVTTTPHEDITTTPTQTEAPDPPQHSETTSSLHEEPAPPDAAA